MAPARPRFVEPEPATTSIFLFSLILGGGLLALSVVGDLFDAGDVAARLARERVEAE